LVECGAVGKVIAMGTLPTPERLVDREEIDLRELGRMSVQDLG
jgi:hypothetical protein